MGLNETHIKTTSLNREVLGSVRDAKSLISKSKVRWLIQSVLCIAAALVITMTNSSSNAGELLDQSSTLEKNNLPEKVREALQTNHEIGRKDWDAMSVDHLAVFDIFTGEEKYVSRTNALEGLLRIAYVSQSEKLSPILDFCEGEEISRPRDCAEEIIRKQRKSSMQAAKRAFGKLNRWIQFIESRDESESETQFRESIETIKKFVQKVVAPGIDLSFLVTRSRWSVDETFVILLSKDAKKIVVLSYNEGA